MLIDYAANWTQSELSIPLNAVRRFLIAALRTASRRSPFTLSWKRTSDLAGDNREMQNPIDLMKKSIASGVAAAASILKSGG